MTSISPGNGGPQVTLILGANHRLGLALCRELFTHGGRIIIADGDPSTGEAMCRRLCWQGTVASFRYISPDQPQGEAALVQDIETVYGRLDAVVSFDPPARQPVGWFALEPGQARRLLEGAIEHRLRLLQALRPLLQRSANPRLAQVNLGHPATQRMAVAGLWQDLLDESWISAGITPLCMETDIPYGEWGSLHLGSVERDLARLTALLGGSDVPLD